MSVEDSPEFEQLLDQYFQLREADQLIDIPKLCQGNPELIQALNSFIESEAHFMQAIRTDHSDNIVQEDFQETLPPQGLLQRQFEPILQNIGKYQLLKVLGEGAMGAVYQAFDTELKTIVALKIPKIKFSEHPEHRSRFFREARSAAALDHPGLCKVYESGEWQGIPYIAMEFIHGQPLSKLIGVDELLNVNTAVAMMREIALAMEVAHRAGIIHRDLKPGNIMVDPQLKPHITDFGLARKIEQSEASRLTHTGAILGTPAYMAPEQIHGNASLMGSSLDIYALGVIIFEVLTGQLPSEGNVTSILAQVLSITPPKPSELNPEIDEELENLCLAMLAKESQQRPVSMQQIADQLDQWLKDNTSEGKRS